MRIFQLTPGSGNLFYCENCLRDHGLMQQFRRMGHDALTVPLYLPIELSEPGAVPQAPLFMGGINVYLQQKSSFFRRFSPRWLDRLFDSLTLLRHLAKKSTAVDAGELAQTTVSILQGEHGRQAKELYRLVEWLRQQQPDFIGISNALLLGIAPRIKQEVGCPVFGFFQDEDEFIDSMPAPYPERIWELIGRQAKYLDGLLAVSAYYARYIQEKLHLAMDAVRVFTPGIEPVDAAASDASPRPLTIGYLSRACPEKGLDVLVETFLRLKRRQGLENLKLLVVGGHAAGDETYVQAVMKNLAKARCTPDVDFQPHFDYAARGEFFRRIRVLCVPEKRPPAYARYALEALSYGTPVVGPRHGALPEIMQKTDGGLLYDEHNPSGLYEALECVLLEEARARTLGQRGKENLAVAYHPARCAEAILEYFEEVKKKRQSK